MDDMEKVSEDIHVRASKAAEGNVYTMTNPYTTSEEKVEIESWYQLPFNTAAWAFIIDCLLWAQGTLNWWQAYMFAAGIGIVTTLWTWFLYSKKTVFVLNMILGFPIIKWLVPIGFAVWLWIGGSSTQAMFLVGNLVLLYFPVAFPSVFLNQILSGKYRMHPKYAFLKHIYDKEYPFE